MLSLFMHHNHLIIHVVLVCIFFLCSKIKLSLITDDEKGIPSDILLTSCNTCRSQMQLSKQMAQLRPELTMPMFSGKFVN